MSFFKRLFSKNDDPADPEAEYIAKLQAATPNVLGFFKEGWIEFERAESGEPIGFWLAKSPPGDRDTFLKASSSFLKAAGKGELSQSRTDMLFLGNYKIVKNTHDSRGGFLVVIG